MITNRGVESPVTSACPLRIRRARPTDRTALERMYDRCSYQTRLHRWLANLPAIPANYLDAALRGSPSHIALVTETDDERDLVALASAASPENATWELGVLVEDRYQSRGVGSRLIAALVDALPAKDQLMADAFWENRRLLAALGEYGPVAISYDNGVVHAVVRRSP